MQQPCCVVSGVLIDKLTYCRRLISKMIFNNNRIKLSLKLQYCTIFEQ